MLLYLINFNKAIEVTKTAHQNDSQVKITFLIFNFYR